MSRTEVFITDEQFQNAKHTLLAWLHGSYGGNVGWVLDTALNDLGIKITIPREFNLYQEDEMTEERVDL